MPIPKRIHRKIYIGWQENQKKANQTYEIIVIKISGLIDKLNISKTQKKNNNRRPIKQTNSHHKGRNAANKKQEISIFAEWFYKLKAII